MKFVTIFDPKQEIDFVKRFKPAGFVALGICFLSILALVIFDMPWGIDFLGGVEMQVKFQKPVQAGDIRDVLDSIEFDKNQVQQFGASANNEMLVRIERMAAVQEKDVNHITNLIKQNFPLTNKAVGKKSRVVFDQKIGNQLNIYLDEPYTKDISDPLEQRRLLDQQKAKLLNLLITKGGLELRKSAASTNQAPDYSDSLLDDDPQNGLVGYTAQFAGVSGKITKILKEKFGNVDVRRVDFVDSQVSRQLRTDGVLSVLYALLAIVIYIALRFDIFFSPGAIIALINDTLGALMVFVIGRVEFDTPSIAAMLTIVGYSINNTIVVYDRIRETVPQNPKKPLTAEELKPYVNKAINDTLSRTINTTLTTLFASMAIWYFASGVIESFAMVLSVGILVGAFSSVFVAPSVYLLAKRYIQSANNSEEEEETAKGPSREDKAKGIV